VLVLRLDEIKSLSESKFGVQKAQNASNLFKFGEIIFSLF
jgi:hypothetical protein